MFVWALFFDSEGLCGDIEVGEPQTDCQIHYIILLLYCICLYIIFVGFESFAVETIVMIVLPGVTTLKSVRPV